MKRTLLLTTAILYTIFLVGRPRAERIDLLGMSNMYKIDADVYRAEQLTNVGFKELEKFGIKEVLNLRYWHQDDKKAKSTSLQLRRVRMSAHYINDYDMIQALKIIKDRKGPIVFHCRHGSDRTGAICAMYRIVFQNVSKEDAVDEMINGGFGFHKIYGNIVKYIENVDADKIRNEVFRE